MDAQVPAHLNRAAAGPLRIAFVGAQNANRSQMAEAFARAIGGFAIQAHSAGSRPSGTVDPKAIASMQRIGYDMASHASKSIADLERLGFEVVVTLGCNEVCPDLRAARRIRWDIPDPDGLPPRQFDAMRDLIGQQVRALIADLRGMEM